jgi:hypothetical protein
MFADISVGKIVGWLLVLVFVAIVARWNDYQHEIKSVAIGVLIIVDGLLEETTWYFWVIVVGTLLWLHANRKSRQRQEMIIQLLAEIRNKLR